MIRRLLSSQVRVSSWLASLGMAAVVGLAADSCAATPAVQSEAKTEADSGSGSGASLDARADRIAETEAESAYGPELEGFDYPAPVARFRFVSQRLPLQMAYLDVRPDTPNARTVVLLHGKNFCAATWEGTMRFLQSQGFRVIVPDQIGFCKSSKPAGYQYSFQQLAHNTRALLESLGIDRFIVIGHSTGGMLATRMALMFPTQVEQLVMVNPIGLEDWKAEGVPSLTVDQWHAREQQVTVERIRDYQRRNYYVGDWRPEYERWVQMLAGMLRGPGRDIVTWQSALLYDMIYTQPVVHEFGKLTVPTLLLVGERDSSAIGREFSPPDVKARLGDYPKLARRAASAIPGAQLRLFPELGHAPQMQDPQRFHQALLEGLQH